MKLSCLNRSARAQVLCVLFVVLAHFHFAALAQNIVEELDAPVFEARALSSEEKALLSREQDEKLSPIEDRLQPYVQRLASEVNAVIDGWPWRPFFHQLGISGAETHFDHPDELFAIFAEALPILPAPVAQRAKAFLAARLRETPPYATEGFDCSIGQPRERYSVPEALRAKGMGSARDAWGVHAFFNYARAAQEMDAAKEHWPAIQARMRLLLENDYSFDPKKTTYAHDEAQRLNGDLAGLYATIRLAKIIGDERAVKRATTRAEQLLQLRLDLERVNPRLIERTDAATKTLHHGKLARYLHLTEPVISLLANDGSAAQRMRPFREARPGWWMAFGDRWIGGENYTTSPDFGRAVFITATRIELARPVPAPAANGARRDPPMQWLDVPWCKADLYFIERLALMLQAPAGR